ncbi:hypothetical protein NDU88_004651 [Pleurodeles waltl]|uniref:Uncharacterized protein n=1 Tax=Pleurodeles waltl TaxID=8319 RepID=A0AAV7NN99_PLEWA|nr:hypothetical protein NDU88_004651 [Pleurodeles waltl]
MGRSLGRLFCSISHLPLPGISAIYSQRGSYRHSFSVHKRSEFPQRDRVAEEGSASVPRVWCELGVPGSPLRSEHVAVCAPIPKSRTYCFSGAPQSGRLSFSVLKPSVLHSAITRRGRAPRASLGPGANQASWAAPSGLCATPPPLRWFRN